MRVQTRKRSLRAAGAAAALMLVTTAAQGLIGAVDADEAQLFLNAGPIPSGVRAGSDQTVFQFVKSGSADGAPVSGKEVSFRVVSGPNAGQEAKVASNVDGLSIWRFNTSASVPTGGADTVTSWIDLNGDEEPTPGEPSNTNVFFTLPAENQPPTAGVVRVSGPQETSIGVQLEGTDPDGRFVSFAILVPPSSGVATLAPAGSYVSYVPNPGFSGTDTFTYGVRDDSGATAQGTVIVTVTAVPPVVPTDSPSCAELTPTLVVPAGQRVAFGTGGNDVIVVEGEGVTVYGRDGDDVICLGEGNNAVYGGGGNDKIAVGAGNNIVYAGDGDDVVTAGDGNNRLYGSGGNDSLKTGNGINEIYGEEGDDKVRAGTASGVLSGGNGNDHLFTPSGAYKAWGGNGDDHFDIAGKTWAG